MNSRANIGFTVVPAKAGTQFLLWVREELDPGFRRDDDMGCHD